MTELPIFRCRESAALLFSGRRAARAGGRCGGGLIGAFLFLFICIVRKSTLFQTVASVNKKLDKISIKRLTINKTLDIL